MTKELAPKQENAVSTDLADWGQGVNVGQDLLIPKLLVMQGISQAVMDEKAKAGDFIDSVSGAKLGSIVDPVEIIPFHATKHWDILHEQDDGKFKWTSTIPIIDEPTNKGYNDNLPWKDKVDGVNIQRVRRLNFYFLFPKDVAENTIMPYVISFKSTSFREGKKLLNQMFVRNRSANLPPPAYLVKIGGTKQKNDKGTFYVPSVDLSRKASVDEIKACLHWFKLLGQGNMKVDESDVQESSSSDDAMEVMQEASGPGAF